MADIQHQSQGQRAIAYLRQHGMARLSELKAEGIAEETVSRLVRAGNVLRLTRGLYQLADADYQAEQTLAEASKMVPKGVICLVSALQYHGLTVQLPSAVWMAIGQTDRKPKIDYPPIKIVRFAESALELGIEKHKISGVEVRIYDPAKTVVDCFRYRNKIGIDVALEGLREAIRTHKALPNDIVRYARSRRIWTVIKPYLEAVMSDDS